MVNIEKYMICALCAILFTILASNSVLADSQKVYTNDAIRKILDNLKNAKKLTEEQLKALEILEKAQRKTKKIKEEKYVTLSGTEPAIGDVVLNDFSCKQSLIKNKDGDTVTYIRIAKILVDGKIKYIKEKWRLLTNANPYFYGRNWENAWKKIKKESKIDNRNYQLPPSKILLEIANLTGKCSNVQGYISGIVRNTYPNSNYWANEKYYATTPSLKDAPTLWGGSVSLYYGKKHRLLKTDSGMVWPVEFGGREEINNPLDIDYTKTSK